MTVNEGPYQNFTAGAVINARRFVKISAAKTVIQNAAGTTKGVGVAPEYAASGAAVRVLTLPGAIQLVEVGTGGVTAGSPVTSDSVGRAVACTTGDLIHGIANETRNANEFAEILLSVPALVASA